MPRSANNDRTRVCFVRPDAIRLFDPSAAGEIGGAQVRSFTFARALADRDEFDVSFVVHSELVRPPSQHDKITLHYRPTASANKAYVRQQAASKLARMIAAARQRVERQFYKTCGILPWRSLDFFSQLDADVFCCFGVGEHSSDTAKASYRLGRRSVVFLVSDQEFDTSLMLPPTASRRLHRKVARERNQSIALADAIVVQTESQQDRLLKQFGRQSTVIRNPIDLRPISGFEGNRVKGPYAFWVGRADTFSKRADRLVELARLAPEVEFLAVMNRFHGDSFNALTAEQPSNLTIVKDIPFESIENYFASATVLLNTSDAEGFPNTFLQAAKYGVPVISYAVDPNQMLSRHQSGRTANGNLNDMADMLRNVWKGGPDLQRWGQAARRYAESYHALPERIDELVAVVRRLRNARTPSRRAA